MTTLMLAVTWLNGAASAACPEAAARDLMVAVQAVETAHANLDISGLQESAQEAVAAVPCAEGVHEPVDAARLHRVVGLDAFTRQERDLATRAFAAARSADSSFAFPTEVVPEGHPLRTYYAALPLDAGTSQAITASSGLQLRLDGVESQARPLSWPTLAQVLEPSGRVVYSGYLWPEDPLPDALGLASSSTSVAAGDPQQQGGTSSVTATEASQGKQTRGKGLRRVALVSTLVAGGAYVGSWFSLRAYDQPDRTDSELDRLFLTTNGLTVGAAAFGVVAVGTGLGAFITRRF